MNWAGPVRGLCAMSEWGAREGGEGGEGGGPREGRSGGFSAGRCLLILAVEIDDNSCLHIMCCLHTTHQKNCLQIMSWLQFNVVDIISCLHTQKIPEHVPIGHHVMQMYNRSFSLSSYLLLLTSE